MTFEELAQKVEEWGHSKGILPDPDPTVQCCKTLEEVTELMMATVWNNEEEAKDAVGDVIVTLIMVSGAYNFTVQEALESAYNVISKRTGKMVNGQFVKDEA